MCYALPRLSRHPPSVQRWGLLLYALWGGFHASATVLGDFSNVWSLGVTWENFGLVIAILVFLAAFALKGKGTRRLRYWMIAISLVIMLVRPATMVFPEAHRGLRTTLASRTAKGSVAP
jgi:hypothetical protein